MGYYIRVCLYVCIYVCVCVCVCICVSGASKIELKEKKGRFRLGERKYSGNP